MSSGARHAHFPNPKKAQHSHTLYALLFHTYEYPIVAKQMKPANEACETCHFPEKFSNDAVKEIKTTPQTKRIRLSAPISS